MGDSVDNLKGGEPCDLTVKEIVWCDHKEVHQNPFSSTTPNVVVGGKSSTYLVVEESKIKLLCFHCLLRATRIR